MYQLFPWNSKNISFTKAYEGHSSLQLPAVVLNKSCLLNHACKFMEDHHIEDFTYVALQLYWDNSSTRRSPVDFLLDLTKIFLGEHKLFSTVEGVPRYCYSSNHKVDVLAEFSWGGIISRKISDITPLHGYINVEMRHD